MNRLGRRPNLVGRTAEAWRPPRFGAPTTRRARLAAAARRFLDLQASSIWNDLVALLPAYKGAVLDVGCGAQPYRGLLHPEAAYQGIDTADAAAHFGYALPDTRYFAGDRWPVADGTIDLVLATETLEHVPDPARFLAEARRCLKPGGGLLLTVPFAARWHYIPHDYWRFTPSSLQIFLKAAGFRDIAVYARGNAATVACYKVMALIAPLLFARGQCSPHAPREAPHAGREDYTGRHLRFDLARLLRAAVGMPLVPILVLLAALAQLTLYGRGGDDCLGYTVLAFRTEGENR
jgi:SAM-dependent methyltransferase